MVIIETPVFTSRVKTLLPDDHYRLLQLDLVARPDLGKIIPGSGGLRKIRWSVPGRGKRGGIRIIYYWLVSLDKIMMLFIYPKAKQEDLTPQQLRVLKRIVEEEYL